MISIHPKTHIIRAFIDYDVIAEFHNRKANLPANVSQRALQHHWDMCCLENTSPFWLLPNLDILTNILKFPSPSSLNSAVPDPSKETSQASGTQLASDTCASEAQASEMQAFRLSSVQMSGAIACRPSPPSSGPGSGHKLWRLGHKVIRDQSRAEELWRQGYNIVLSIESDTGSWVFASQTVIRSYR